MFRVFVCMLTGNHHFYPEIATLSPEITTKISKSEFKDLGRGLVHGGRSAIGAELSFKAMGDWKLL